MRPIYLPTLLAILSLLASSALAADPVEKSAQPARLLDEFDGQLSLDWKQVRPVLTHQSLTKSPGKLTITTQYGSIHRIGRPELAKNLFLIDIPENNQAEFVATTILDDFQLRTPYNQAGLLVYNDDDNYLKFVCEFSSAGVTILNAILEQDGESVITNFPVPLNSERLWLRVTKRGNVYECSSSNDGKGFTSYTDLTWTSLPKQVGLLAKNGSSQEADEVDARFDSFELRPLTVEEKDNAAQRERLKLCGTWQVVSGKFSGKTMTNTALTSVAIEPGTILLKEQNQTVKASCVIDTSSTPTNLKVCVRGGTTFVLLNWAYQIDGDDLTLCTILKPNAEAPDSLETKEGDGRLLLTLRRAEMMKQ
jgi:hypothetical protein